MTLPQADVAYLIERSLKYSVQSEAGMTCVVLESFQLPEGYDPARADLLIRLSPGYPDVPPDMWWFNPSVRLMGGGSIPCTQHFETHLGKTWQRWSRHFNAGQWKSGVDSLESYVALIRKELKLYVPATVQ